MADPFVGLTFDVQSGEDLEPYFAQMPTGTPARIRLERGGTWSGDYRYQQGGGVGVGSWHYIEAAPDPTGLLPFPVISGTLQLGIDATPIHNLVVRRLRFTNYGPKALGNGTNLRLRRLELPGVRQGIVVQAGTGLTWTNVLIKKCSVLDLDTQGSGEHGNGMYCARVNGLSVVDNILDHAVAPLDGLSHHLYIQNGCTGLVVRRNLLTRASSHALQARPGGCIDHNLVLDCPIGILVGGGTAPESGGVVATMNNNVVLGGGNIDPLGANLARGWAYYLENIASGVVTNNIAADGAGGDQRGLTKDCSVTGPGAPGEPDVTMVGVLNVTGTNYHRNHDTVHTDSGPSTGTTVSLVQAPTTSADLSYGSLGLTWDAIRAGDVDVLGVIQQIKARLGLVSILTDSAGTHRWSA